MIVSENASAHGLDSLLETARGSDNGPLSCISELPAASTRDSWRDSVR